MPLDFAALAAAPRLLLEAKLAPIQGTRFQPTGFPNLGAATYDGPDGRRMLLVESAQSVANWLERAIFKELGRSPGSDDLLDEVKGISFVEIDCGDFGRTSTLLESHRINTPYLWDSIDPSAVDLQQRILDDLGIAKKRKKKGTQAVAGESDEEATGRVDLRRFYRTLLKYDLNSLIHGAFLEKVAGRLRVSRALSGFVEAADVTPAESGGTKFDHIFPAKDESRGVTANDGYANVLYPRTEFAAREIVAYFNLDLGQIRGYALESEAERLLIALSLYKVTRLLQADWDLRSNCKFKVQEVQIRGTNPKFELPSANELSTVLPDMIRLAQQKGLLAGVNEVKWVRKKAGEERPAGPTGDK